MGGYRYHGNDLENQTERLYRYVFNSNCGELSVGSKTKSKQFAVEGFFFILFCFQFHVVTMGSPLYITSNVLFSLHSESEPAYLQGLVVGRGIERLAA